MALEVKSWRLTAVANEYGYEEVFARQIGALGARKDAAIGISTSGNSPNVLRGIAAARQLGMLTVGLTGKTGGELKRLAGFCLFVPSRVGGAGSGGPLLARAIVQGGWSRVLGE